MGSKTVLASAVLAAVGASVASAGTAIPHNFNAYGSSVHGYQDFFTGTTFNSNYEEIAGGAVGSGTTAPGGSGSNFTLSGGPDATSVLHMTANNLTGDPNKLLYNAVYNSSTQTVLALITVTSNLPGNDVQRGGVATVSNATNGLGINSLFTDHYGSGARTTELNDAIAWGNEGATAIAASTPYWLEVTHDSSNNVMTKLWLADGTTPEPSTFEVTQSGFGSRTGLAGLVTDTNDNGNKGNTTFDVGYFLLQADGTGLSDITAGQVPEPASLGVLSLAGLGLLARRRRNV